MSYKDGGAVSPLKIAGLVSALVLMIATPRPWGYVVVLSATIIYGRRLVRIEPAPRYVVAAALVYGTTFLLDLALVGPPSYIPPWWEAVVLAPLAEEFVFRALPFTTLPSPLSWIFSVVIFGALHPANPLLASLYGLALSLMYRGGGYAASVALHAFNNALWILLATRNF
ncbi:MAG: CPBP family intramembrane glutamic endopeptidase [Pyrobaculum sp.]